jgi:parallel beta-helix repeat protein
MRGSVIRRICIAGTVMTVSLAATASTAWASNPLVVGPGDSIQAVVDAAKPGQTVDVLAGTYHEAVCLTADGVSLRGHAAVIVPPVQAPHTPCESDPSGQTVGIAIVGNLDLAAGEVLDPISDVTVSGFRVEGFASFGIGMIGGRNVDIVGNTAIDNNEYGIARFVSTGGVLRGNRVTGSEEAGLYLGDSPEANASIIDNTAWNNGFFGIFVRDSTHGRVTGNTSYGNCVGIMVFSEHSWAPAGDWVVTGNSVRDNTKACPASEEGPPLSGIGVALAGAQGVTVRGNVVTGNRAGGPSIVSGGVVVFSTAGFGGLDPSGNLVQGNVLRDNDPDLFNDGTGTDNRFIGNACQTSAPTGLC